MKRSLISWIRKSFKSQHQEKFKGRFKGKFAIKLEALRRNGCLDSVRR